MGDYGRNLEFGVSIEPLAAQADGISRLVRKADTAGLDLVGIQDHPYQRRFLDTWTLISTLVPKTEDIRFFPDVANLPLRPPAMLAKAAASLDVISGGRVEIGLGAGAFWDAIAAMDGPRRSPGEAVRSTEEAVRVIRLVWSEERSARFEGEFYSLRGVRPGPHPVHEIGIWIGAYGPRMIEVTGRLADGWIPSLGLMSLERLSELQNRLDDAASRADREPSEIRRALNVSGTIGPPGEGLLDGPVSLWVDRLSRLTLEFGMDTFIIWPRGDQEQQAETFAGEIVPAVREAVTKERKGRVSSQ